MKSVSIKERPLFWGELRPSGRNLTMEDWERAQADNPGFVIPMPGAERNWVKEEFKRRLGNPKYSSQEKSSSYLALEYRRRKAEGTL